MNAWIIISAVLLIACAALTAGCAKLRGLLREQKVNDETAEMLERENKRLRNENARRQRECATLRRALEAEQDHGDRLHQALDAQTEIARQAQQQAENADAKRVAAEKDIYAGRMRIDLLEREIDQMQKEQLAQEQLYQDIFRDHQETIAKLQDQQKRRTRKKPDVLDQQITLSDILKGA